MTSRFGSKNSKDKFKEALMVKINIICKPKIVIRQEIQSIMYITSMI